MTAKTIAKSKIPNLISHLAKKFPVFGPVKNGTTLEFGPIQDAKKFAWDYQTTILPPKIYFLPPEEELFQVANGKVEEIKQNEPFILFGLNLKDVSGIIHLDNIMAKNPADTFYQNRRHLATLIAVSEENVSVPPGGDLILEKISQNSYRAIAPTLKGRKIAALPFFENKKINTKPKPKQKLSKLDEMLLDSELLARAVEWSRTGYPKIWEELEKTCLGCGICTYVCPLCYCTTQEDKITFDKSICTRCRLWDACTLPDFSVVGRHNFRPTLKDRYFNWFYHKFVRAYKEFGQAQCTGCGRCQKYCPAGINIEKVLEEITEAFQKAHPKRKF